MDKRIIAAAAGAVVAAVGPLALANPYAGTVTEAAGQVTFRLNEQADEVIVIRDGVPTSLGSLGRGSHTFARSGAAVYQIVARKAGTDGYQHAFFPNTGTVNQISDDNLVLHNFDRTEGIAINQNPATPNLFGRVYFAAPRNFTTGFGRVISEGIFVMNPDQTETFPGQGDVGRTAGIDFAAGGNSSPFRLALDNDGNLYIADWSDAAGTVYRTDPDVTTGGNMLTGQGSAAVIAPSAALNHGSVGALVVTGSLSAGNLTLYTIDEDMSPDGNPDQLNSLWRYNINAGPLPTSQIPTQLARSLLIDDLATGGIIVDAKRGRDGKFYLNQNRSVGTEAGLFVVADDGLTPLYDSLADSQERNIDGNIGVDGVQDVLRATRNVAVSPDGRWMAAAAGNTDIQGSVILVPLLAGIPDIANRLNLAGFVGTTNDGVAFDPAGNLYAMNRTEEILKIFSPGGLSVTALGSNGTFVMDPTYTGGAGNYSTAGNWLAGVVSTGAVNVARFAGAGGNVNIDAPLTIGTVKFDSASSYTLSGSNTISLQGGAPHIMSLQGNHTISAPVLLRQSAGLVADGGTLTIQNLSVDTGAAVPVEIYTGGTGVVAANRYVALGLYVTSGTTRVIPGGTSASTSNVKRLRIAGGSTPIAKLDITNNAFVVDYSGVSPLAEVRAQITSAYNGGAWTGNGITSSNANASNFGIGYAEASTLPSVPAIFGSVDADAVLFRHTRYGDANLDGQVNLSDFNRLASNFGATSGDWSQGDFNYDGNVNLTDFNRLASNFGLSAAGPEVTPDDWARLGAAVPEPSSVALLGIGAIATMRRRRRRA